MGLSPQRHATIGFPFRGPDLATGLIGKPELSSMPTRAFANSRSIQKCVCGHIPLLAPATCTGRVTIREADNVGRIFAAFVIFPWQAVISGTGCVINGSSRIAAVR